MTRRDSREAVSESRIRATVRPAKARLLQIEFKAVLARGRHMQIAPLLRRKFQRVGDELDPFGRWLLMSGDELVDIGRRAAGLGGKLGLRHTGLGERDAHRGSEWTCVS